MKLTGKCKVEFEKWYRRTYYEDDSVVGLPNLMAFPTSMQYGVYVDFFLSKKMYLYIKPLEDLFSIYIDWQGHHILTDYIHDETLTKSRTKAIEKANEIYNKTK